ncbi:hypothetical protein MASR1M74_23920 [Lentimicrobium sp.]
MKIAFNIHLTTDGPFTGLRYFLLKSARDLSLTGTLKYSREHNSIHIHCEGTEKQLRQFISICSSGNSFSTIGKITFNLAEVGNFENFDILSSVPPPANKQELPEKKSSFRLGLFGF